VASIKKSTMVGHWRVRVFAGGRQYEQTICPESCAEPSHAKFRRHDGTTRGREKVAGQIEDEVRAKVERGHDTPTVAEMCERLCISLAGKGRAASTLVGYRSRVTNWIEPSKLGAMAVDEVRPSDIARQRERWTGDTGAAPSTINQAMAVVSGALQLAVDVGLIDANPSRQVRRVEQGARKPTAPTIGDVRAVAEWLHPRDAAASMFVLLASVLGARRSEILALRWQDVDLDGGWVLIAEALDTARIGERKPTKTHGVRRVPISAGTVAGLTGWREGAQAKSANWEPSWPLIPSPGDPSVPPHPDTISSALKRASKVCGVNVMPLGLRHFAASQMVALGVDGRTAADHLGHADPSMTLRTYAAGDETAARAAADLLGALVPMPEISQISTD
jgi:integrase